MNTVKYVDLFTNQKEVEKGVCDLSFFHNIMTAFSLTHRFWEENVLPFFINQ